MSEQRDRVVLGAMVASALAIAVLGLVDRYADREEQEASGTVVGLYKKDSDVPEPTQFPVQLDGGPRVVVAGTGHLSYREGQRVVVRTRRGAVFGCQRYRFDRFIAPP